MQFVKLLPATNWLGFDSHRVKECVVFQSRSLADTMVSPCVTIIISTLVCPALVRYGSFNLNIGGVLAVAILRDYGRESRRGSEIFFQDSYLAVAQHVTSKIIP